MIPIPPQVLIAAAKVVLPKLIGAGLSYSQAAKQNKLMKESEKAAQQAISEAKDFAGALAYEKVQVPLEAYELSQRELTAQQQQGVEALRESGARSILGGVGRLQAGVTKAQQQIQGQMANALFERDKLVAKDEAQSFDDLSDIAKLEATGAQAAAAQAQAQRGAALMSGTTALAGGLIAGFSDPTINPLYGAGLNAPMGTTLGNASAGEMAGLDGIAQLTGLSSDELTQGFGLDNSNLQVSQKPWWIQ